MLPPASRHMLDVYWAGVFGCKLAGLRPSAPSVLSRPGNGGSRGVYVMEFGVAPVALLSAELMETHAGRVRDVLASGPFGDAERWRGIFGDDVERVIGPAVLRYADAGSFRPLVASLHARLLSGDDLPEADALRLACAATEWEHGGSDVVHDVTAGTFADGRLAALAGYEAWGGTIAHISVVAHPAYRGRGLAAAAVSRVTSHALDAGYIAQYRTLESNTPSLAIAARLGFRPYARSLAVRLRAA